MSEAKSNPTPGPWTWDGSDLWHFGAGYMPDEKTDPHLYTGISYDRRLADSPILKANKAMIAAAPLMYEALRKIVAAYNSGDLDAGDMIDASIAIAAARGEVSK